MTHAERLQVIVKGREAGRTYADIAKELAALGAPVSRQRVCQLWQRHTAKREYVFNIVAQLKGAE